jgi:BA14K-like protein
MTSYKMLGAAAILSMMIAAPVFAQATIDEPGEYSFYHPDSDRETTGTFASVPFGESHASASASVSRNADASSCAQRYRSYDPASGTFLGRDGVRHSCQ